VIELESLTEIFSYVCGQQRCFIVDGLELPLCQRCLGLYLGAEVTLVWLVASGIWRRGLPPATIAGIHATALVAAMLGGLHLLVDGGPVWRFACGLGTGHVVAFWLVGATVHLWRSLRPGIRVPPWHRRDRCQAIVAILAICTAAPGWPILLQLGWGLCSAAALVGVLCLAALVTVSLLAVTGWIVMGLAHRIRSADTSTVS